MQAFILSRGIRILAALGSILFCATMRAQVVPAGYEPAHALWAGAEYANSNASFPYQSNKRLNSIGAFADFHWNYRIWMEGEALWTLSGGFYGTRESSYLAGPKVYLKPGGRLRPYGKVLAGSGKIHYPFAIGDASYVALAPGAGLDYRLSRRLMLRAEYEYQLWPGSPGFANEPGHELTPNGIHLGLAYRIRR